MRYHVLALLGLASVIAYVQRSAIGVTSKAMEAELGVGPGALGLVMAAWYWAYAAAQLPAGWVADRWGSRAALIAFAGVWSVLTGLVGLAAGFSGLLLLWAGMGVAQAGLFPCATKAIGSIFPRTEQAFASGVLAACMALGAAVAPVLTAELLRTLTWQQTFVFHAIPGLMWAVAYALFVPRFAEPRPASGAAPDWGTMIRNPHMLLLCTQQFLRASAMAFFFTWFPRFLQETKGVTPTEAGWLAACPCIGGMLGGLAGGAFSDWMLRRTGNARLSRQGVACAAMLACTGLAAGASFAADPLVGVLLISLGAFFGMGGGVSGYTVAIAFGGSRVGVVFGTMNMAGNVGAGLFPFVVGWMVTATGNWDLALHLFTGLFLADAVCWAVLNPRGTLFGDNA
jgi:sugar phosphate permease